MIGSDGVMVLLLITGLLHISRFKVEEDAGPLFCPKPGGGGLWSKKSPWAAQSQTD